MDLLQKALHKKTSRLISDQSSEAGRSSKDLSPLGARLLVVLREKVSGVEGPMAKQVGTLEFFLASTLKGKTDAEIATVLELVVDTMNEVLRPQDEPGEDWVPDPSDGVEETPTERRLRKDVDEQ